MVRKRKLKFFFQRFSALIFLLIATQACQQVSGTIPGETQEDPGGFESVPPDQRPGGTACNPAKYTDPNVTDGTNLSGAFACTLYPALHFSKDKGGFGCINCHANESAGAPLYLSDHTNINLQVLESAKLLIDGKKVNLVTPSGSAIVKKMKTGHNCDNKCEEWGNTMILQMSEWIKLSKVDPNTLTPSIVNLKSSELSLPFPDGLLEFNNPLALTSQKLVYNDIKDVKTGASIPGVTFEINYSKNSNFGWLFFNPTIKSTKSIQVKNIAILINDVNLATNATWRTLDVVVPANSTEIANVSTAYAPVDLEDEVTEFKISFGFEILKESSSSGGGGGVIVPPTAAQRLQIAKDVISQRCLGCHAANPSGGVRFDNPANNNGANLVLAGATEAIWEAFRFNGTFGNNTLLIDKANPTNSALYRLVKGVNLPAGQGAMPPTAAQTQRDADAEKLLDFISKIGQN